MSTATTDALKIVLADSYTLYLKTQNYHWNVTGPQFKTLHLLFEEQYTDLAAAVDEIAERIRALGSKAPASFKNYDNLRTLKDGNENASAPQMIQELAADQELIVTCLKTLLTTAQKAGDEATADLAIGRIALHEKNAWMLKSSL
ncbi:MAG: dps1 [Rickettsiales bacterium]|jgi:starvation-inducible DNA-binding protein|nr:dps1 [Rickettsiales bacterium]